MRQIILLLLCLSISFSIANAQQTYTLSGTVLNERNNALPGATVKLYPSQKGAATASDGSFVINGLSKGSFRLEISYLGYQNFRDTIYVNGNMVYHASLVPEPTNLHEVVIQDDAAERRKSEEALNIEVVNDEYLKQNLGGSLMGSLERLPGVSQIEIGSGQSKPVIRGLAFNRVVVVENSVKHEAQQWGADHGLEIDQYAVNYVEVIKGPASLMYGSDAIGGVIDMQNQLLPDTHSLGGKIDLSGRTNNDLLGGSVNLYGRKDALFADFRFSYLDYGDYKVPTDSVDIYSFRAPLHKRHLRNTAGKEQNYHLTVGWVKKHFQSKLLLSRVQTQSGFFANTHGLEPRMVDTDLHDASSRDIQFPFQKVNHTKVISKSQYLIHKWKMELDLGFQRNLREEWSQYVDHGYMPAVFPDTASFNPDLERQFEKYVYSANLKFAYRWKGINYLRFGLNAEYQHNDIDGRGFIIPAYHQKSFGSYVIFKRELSSVSHVQGGLRYDFGNVNTQVYNDWFPSPVVSGLDTVYTHLQRAQALNRNFSAITWSLGYSYAPEHWSYKLNAGKSFRMPLAKELAANGVNYHRFSYELGNADLKPEQSYQLDAGVEYQTKRFTIGLTPFVNYFTNYIYLNPSSDHDRLYGNGNQVFYYVESEVFRYGTELNAHTQILKNLQAGFIGEYVYAQQLTGAKKGFSLPFSPPASAIFNLNYTQQQLAFAQKVYASVDFRVNAAQNRIVPPEITTEASQTVNLSLGGSIQLWKQSLNLSFQVRNLFNQKYFSHTSYYRLINVPEPGRNYVLNISIPFSIK